MVRAAPDRGLLERAEKNTKLTTLVLAIYTDRLLLVVVLIAVVVVVSLWRTAMATM